MSLTQRRDFLALSGLLTAVTSVAARAERQRLSIPPPAKALPGAWSDAPKLAIWPGPAPGADSFRPTPVPPDSPPVFIRNILKPELAVFRPARPNGQAILVVPGGAYLFVSVANEGVDVARLMNAAGVTVFVLTYRLPSEGWQNRSAVPLQDAQRALRVIRSQAARFSLDPQTVAVLGFSAGGHLAATLATQHSERAYEPVDSVDELDPRPHAAGLVYPVISMEKPLTHAMSRELLLGDSPTEAQIVHRCAERNVTQDTPPTFLVHAFDDDAVPVENSIRFMDAMRTAKRPVEAHLLQEGGHAFGVGYPDTPSAHWTGLFLSWLRRLS